MHLFAYVATVLILFFVNLTVTPKVWWFYWVALGWGAGLVPHGWCAFFKRRRVPCLTAAPARPRSPSRQSGPKSAPKRPRKPRSKKPKT